MYEKQLAEGLVDNTWLKVIATIISEDCHFWLETFLNPSKKISHPLNCGS